MARWFQVLSLLLLLTTPALAGPTLVERTLAELPPEVGTDATLVVVSAGPGAVRWGTNGWTLPPATVRAGTTTVAAGAVETPLVGPAIDGRWRARLGPFRQGVTSVELVVRHDDGSWETRAGQDARVAVRSGAPSRRRPITLGRGPSLGRSGRVELFEELQDWEAGDCRGMDRADDARDLGDGKDAARDLIALYSRREADALYLRADLLDLGLGDEQTALDVVVLVDCAPGGQTWLPDFAQAPSGAQLQTGWELAITVDHGTAVRVLDAAWRTVAGASRGAYVRSDLDAVELGVGLPALRAAGWDGRTPLAFAAYTLRDGDARVADVFQDTLARFVAEDALGGTAKYSVILHGNQAVQSPEWLHDLVESRRTLTPNGNPTGYGRALDAHELLRQPVNIHISGTLAATAEWAAKGFNDRVRGFLDGRAENGEGALMGGVLAEHIMPYFENAPSARGGEGVNARATRLNDELLDRIYGGPRRGVFWIPERVTRGTTLPDVLADARGRATGYRHSVVDQTTHLTTWFGAQDANGRNGHKLNRISGVSCFVINDGADQWKFANTDDGLWVWTRRDLVAKALDPDQEQLTLVFDDWEAFSGRSFTSFGVGNDNPDNYEKTLRWLANHPWVQVVTLDEVAAWGWREVERGDLPGLPIETYDWLRHASQTSYDQWYFGSSQEESFAGLRVETARGVFGPKPFGAVDRSGTLLADVWSRVAGAPAGRLKELAEAVYVIDMFETAWHDEDMNEYHAKTASGAYAKPDTTFDRVSGWARAMHARVGDAGLVAAAARWSASPPASVRTWREDVDEDGEGELLVADARAFFAFEDDGGRLVLAAARDPQTGKADALIAGLLHAPGEQGAREVESTDEHGALRPHGLIDWWATGAGKGARYVNAPYAVEQRTDGWRLRSDDGLVTKTLTLRAGRLEVEYDVAPAAGTLYVRTGLSPATLDLFMGSPLVTTTRADGAVEASAARSRIALVPGAGARIQHGASFGGRGARGVAFAHQVEVEGAGRFTFALEVEVR